MTNQISDLQEIRKINGRKLLAEYPSSREFANAAGIAPAQVSGLFGKNPTITVGDKIARRLERQCFKLEGWMDINHEAEPVEKISTEAAAKCMVAMIETLDEHGTRLEDLDGTKLFYLLERIFSKASEQTAINRHYVKYMLVTHQIADLKKS